MKKNHTAIFLLIGLTIALLASCGASPVAIEPALYPASGGGALTASLDVHTMSALTGLSAAECAPAAWHTDDQTAYLSLLSGENQLIFVSSPPDEETERTARINGISFEMTPVARDALVFYVNENNPIKSLTKSELARIYAGEVTDWRELAGDHGPIEAYRSADDDFYTRLLSEKIMAGALPEGGPDEAFLAFAHDPLLYDLSGERAGERPAAYRNAAGAIAYGSRFLLAGSEKERGIALLSLNGITPTPSNLTSGKYELTYDIYAVILSTARPESAERTVVSWLLSREGKNTVKEAGYAPAA